MARVKGISMELARAEEYVSRHGGVILRRRDGFVLVFKEENGKKILIWFRKTPITRKSVKFLEQTLKRIAHDEVWLLKLYLEPDFTDKYRGHVAQVFSWRELMDNNEI